MAVPIYRIIENLFGKPTLASNDKGLARWVRGNTSPLDQKGNTGWLVELNGGVQSGDDWARINVPAYEVAVPDFKTALWTYWMTSSQSMGVNIVIWIHDPQDYSKRAEVTQTGGASGLGKSAGWNAHSFNKDTVQMFFYGENTTGTALTAGTQYAWTSFQTDVLFEHWTIYRITLEYGWEASGTFNSVYVADLSLNGYPIYLQPETFTHTKMICSVKALAAASQYDAGDVLSESASAGTDWDFDFGGVGYITSAQIVSETTALTPLITIMLYSAPPTGALNDHLLNTNPVAADITYRYPRIDMPAMTSIGTGLSSASATPSTGGNLPILFTKPQMYAVVVTNTAFTQGAGKNFHVILGADMIGA